MSTQTDQVVAFGAQLMSGMPTRDVKFAMQNRPPKIASRAAKMGTPQDMR